MTRSQKLIDKMMITRATPLFLLISTVKAFTTSLSTTSNNDILMLYGSQSIIDDDPDYVDDRRNMILKRRSFVQRFASTCGGISAASLSQGWFFPSKVLASTGPDIEALVSQLKEARAQLEPVPTLIKEEKWDSVRAILITPPLADCWAKTSKPLLKQYAEVQDALENGDELTALELREEALDHLRFLDMAVYNNVFNPIKTEGETGATKELIRSYYEDPVKEYQASVKVLDELILLSK